MDVKWIGFGAALGIVLGVALHNYALGFIIGIGLGALISFVKTRNGR